MVKALLFCGFSMLVSMFVSYNIMSFILWDWNPFYWTSESRGFCVLLTFMVGTSLITFLPRRY